MPNRDEVLQQDTIIWDLARKGWSADSIAVKLKIHRRSVDRRLSLMRKRAWDRMAEERQEEIMSQVHVLHYIVEEALDSWRESKKPSKSVTKRTVVSRSGQGQTSGEMDETIGRSDNQHGDPRYLDKVFTALDTIRKLKGVDTADKLLIGITSVPGGPAIQDINLNEMDSKAKALYLQQLATLAQTMSHEIVDINLPADDDEVRLDQRSLPAPIIRDEYDGSDF